MARILRGFGILITFGFLVSLYTPLWNFLGSQLAIPTAVDSKANAIVVLASDVLPDGSLSDESLRRVVRGIEVFREGRSELLVLSGPRHRGYGSKSEAEVRRDLALRMGVPSENIKTIELVSTTRDEARDTASLLSNAGDKSIILITSAVHMRRAAATFGKAGLKVKPINSDTLPNAARSVSDRWKLMFAVIQQSGAFLYYRIAGYV
jgi:uncharacterized SAM-binding protein YcdF (DUF218 family)